MAQGVTIEQFVEMLQPLVAELSIQAQNGRLPIGAIDNRQIPIIGYPRGAVYVCRTEDLYALGVTVPFRAHLSEEDLKRLRLTVLPIDIRTPAVRKVDVYSFRHVVFGDLPRAVETIPTLGLAEQ